MIFLFNLFKFLLSLGLFSYAILVVLSLRSFITGKYFFRKQWWFVVGGPFILIGIGVFLFLLTGPAAEERFSRWTEECGHAPILITTDLYGMPSASFSKESWRAMSAKDYHCTIEEAERDGYRLSEYEREEYFKALRERSIR